MARLLLSLTLLLGFNNAVADCTFDIEVGDALTFSTDAIEVGADCSEVTINLNHTGSLPAAAMGHNWVLSKSTDLESIATAGMTVGLEGNYVPAGDDRVLAASKVIGGGESTSLTFSTEGLSTDESYSFFCSFPGHWAVMKGSFTVAG